MLSPGVKSTEKDLTYNTQSITTNASGMVGLFRWGPVNEVVSITTNESELVRRFGQPDNTTAVSFLSAANYLKYASPLLVVRAADETTALNAAPATTGTPAFIPNLDSYDNAALDGTSFIGRYPGDLGNSISLSAADDTAFDTWAYADEFDYAPSAGEFNLVVVDEDGMITGNAGTVLERYSLMQKTAGATKPDGTAAYIKTVIKDQSNWVLVGDVTAIDFAVVGSEGIYEVSLDGGVDGNDSTTADYQTAASMFDTETVELTRMFGAGMPATSFTGLVDIAVGRQDMVVFGAPTLSDVYNTVDAETNVVEYFTTTVNKNTSYAFYVDNWKLVYDKYNDHNVWIPCDSDAAALHARTFAQNEPWFSPAGLNRGQLKNVIRLAWNPNRRQRDVLYKNSINSIVAFPGEGTVLFGDKTALRRPSAFSRINVRTLLIVLRKAISSAAKYQLFELNDIITRGVFRNGTDQYLGNVQARRGLYDYRVKCDETNNTAQVIDANEFVGDIYLKPARSINFIRLNFIAVASGVDFEEVEGA